MRLDHFDVDQFLKHHWQKKPLRIANPWHSWRNPLEPDELAGLACEEGIESRLITQASGTWNVEHGPIAPSRFGQLEAPAWTLLVQAVDHHVPDVAMLLEAFRFIPNWRVDDVMVSYATDGGGVGPHFDQYDVFLVQGLGRRRWQIGPCCDQRTELLPHEDLRLISDFAATEEWVLDAGDILYLPPGIAHNGVALGDDCMTYSIGFRAPSRRELIESWCEHIAAGLSDDDRYRDPDLARQRNPGEINADALATLHGMVLESLRDQDAFARWFGLYSSTPKATDLEWEPDEPVAAAELRASIADGAPLIRNPASRFSFIRQSGKPTLLFVDGACFECTSEAGGMAEALCAQPRLVLDPALAGSSPAIAILAKLTDQGSIAFDQKD